MYLSKRHIEKFKELYRKRFGKEITTEEAMESGAKLINLMRLIYKPITKKDYEELKARETTNTNQPIDE